ncbi:hypothetical protein JTB14_018766 [Gonioctena quinquepunctata]|nr:hypothetical protein JTB14_018766 [Gonioctena quinquepunctata]
MTIKSYNDPSRIFKRRYFGRQRISWLLDSLAQNYFYVGRETEVKPFLCWTALDDVVITYFAPCTTYGATGSWVFEDSKEKGGYQDCWIAAINGEVPSNAFPGGEENGEKVFVVRAKFKGILLPGKLLPSQGVCYLTWDGAVNGVPEYEVLCNSPGQWTLCYRADIPLNALSAGKYDKRESFYVGRAIFDGGLLVERVHGNCGKCYFAQGEKKIVTSIHEILGHFYCG